MFKISKKTKSILIKAIRNGLIVMGFSFFSSYSIHLGIPTIQLIESSIATGGLVTFTELMRAYQINYNSSNKNSGIPKRKIKTKPIKAYTPMFFW